MTALRMTRNVSFAASAAVAIGLAAHMPAHAVDAASGPAMDARIHAQVDTGKQLFVTSCANCHGSDAKGAIGPALADRNLPPDVIRTTILNGRVGTPMPPFKDEFDAKSLAALMAYVQWATSGGRLPSAVIASAPEGTGASATIGPSAVPVAVGQARGTPARGAELFFDPTRLYSCRTCHSYANKGGPVGPDLNSTSETRLEVYESITRAKVASADFPAIGVELRDGTRLLGVKGEETADAIRLFDVSSLPPVSRSVPKSTIDKVTAVQNSGIYDHTKLPYSKQDLLDLSAFLGKQDTSAATNH